MSLIHYCGALFILQYELLSGVSQESVLGLTSGMLKYSLSLAAVQTDNLHYL
jgi:hypothetical protein